MKRLLLLSLVALCACSGTSVKLFDNTVIDGRPSPRRESLRPVVWGAGLPLRAFDPNGEAG